MAQDMGIGQLGLPSTSFKRKFRWTLAFDGTCAGTKFTIPANFVKMAARPNISIEETEINYLNGVTWIPGKGRWESITVTYYDTNNPDIFPLYNWLASVYGFHNPTRLPQGGTNADYSRTGTLTMYDGCGEPMEVWILKNCWPTSINWGDLDYSNSETADIELTLRYSSVTYTPKCFGARIASCCTPCGGGGGSLIS